ncbi:hypothetical protein AEAC466_05255 [Asticcacaulis sp. AC466]|uniref:FecR family protein n=1 Tax=Asticcacaulis sp. AC466 TaxID=1282362 RepID=UPI0003C40254|nr:FecR domain-containing protein [Asticcacaulis sp. AC466]ESQ85119.1 hypothetical protein AEAC466_05255 [Asticcacaulis sp. AC466]
MIRAIDQQRLETPEEQAAGWLIRMQGPIIEAHVERQFELWISADERHAMAYADILATYDIAGEIAAEGPRKSGQTLAPWYGLGAAVAACLVLGLVVSRGLPAQSPVPQHTATLTTGPGETLDIPLPDGTRIALSGASAMRVSYTSGARHVDLTRGEAYFDVAHDEHRPFVVTVHKTEVRVLGTAFNIDLLSGDQSEVSVYRGRVRVAADGKKRDLTVGQKVMTGESGLTPVSFEAGEGPDWRSGWFDAEETSLTRLVDELNRYATRPIRLEGAALSHITISGRFKISDPERVIRSLKTGYGLRSSVRNNVLVLTK